MWHWPGERVVQKIILDMDPGIDDALAIILALRSPELQVEAITTVSGNVHVDQASKNALKIVENIPDLKKKPEVAKGLSKPLFGELTTAEAVHGKDGLGDSNLPEPKQPLSKKHAVDLIIEKVLSSKEGELTIVTTGPLSNLAFALLKEPGIVENVGQLIMMGGAFGVTKYGFGNVTPVAEFNIYSDPEAAMIVLKSGLYITAVGLGVTMDPSALITQKEYDKIQSAKTKSAELVRRITRSHMASFGSLALHDPMAVAVAIDPSLVTRKKYFVEVETRGESTRGQTIADRRGNLRPKTVRVGNPMTLCTSVLGEKFIKLFMNRVILQT